MKSHVIEKSEKESNQSQYAPANSIAAYFNLPREQREKWGFWYLHPIGLPLTELDEFTKGEETEDGWTEFKRLIRKEYPIQGWFREWLLSFENPLYSFFMIKARQCREIQYKIKCFFFPRHKRIRKALPRTWSDICYLIRAVNFAMILDFYYGEMVDGWINWQSDQQHRSFLRWIKGAVKYIEKDRFLMVKKIDNAWDNYYKNNKPAVLQIAGMEKRLADKDKKILKEMIDWKEMFWT